MNLLRYVFLSLFILIMNLAFIPEAKSEALSLPDSSDTNSERVNNTSNDVSGIEIHKRNKSENFRLFTNTLLFIPRNSSRFLLHHIGKGANFATEEEIIERVKEVLYFYEDGDYNFGWFPYANLVSGDKVGVGAGSFFKTRFIRGYSRYVWVDENIWNFKFSLKHYYNNSTKSSFGLKSTVNFEDDRVYYGIGKDPESDARSLMYSSLEDTRGNYRQEYYSLSLYLQHNFNEQNRLSFSTNYFHRVQGTNEELEENISLNFDYEELLLDYHVLYHELSYLTWFNNYKDELCLSHLEVYSGLANIIEGTAADYFRAGFDLEYDQPIFFKNRILASRLVFNMVEELDKGDLAFADYARSTAFRGVSSRHLLRIDRLSAVPSIEYRWPVSWKLHGFIFGDALIVGRRFSDLEIDGSTPWATGLGMNIVHKRKSVGGFFFAYGSEGFRATLKIGSSLSSNDRLKWY